ncbi:DUF7282 domain-containing protein [Halosimplex halophilum]|uniref:DUF7282 domain-containing protein n=1 Tax=Halosimplex halophilum TaxID=2559572 RepID=UPI00107EEB90|nr:hypothetical protein [Halosimplex halophilum]
MTATPSRGAVATVVTVALVAAALAAGSAAAPGGDGPAGETDRPGADRAVAEHPPNGTNATVMVAPRGSVDRLTSVAAIDRGREAGWVTRSPVVADGDTVVFRLRLPGMADRVANATGDTAGARFQSVLAGEHVSLRLVQRHVSPHGDRRVFYLNGSRGQAVAADTANDTYYVAADLAVVPRATGGPGIDDHFSEAEFVPRLLVDGDHRLNPGSVDEPNRTGRFVLLDRAASLSGADLDGDLAPGFAAAPNQTVTGYTPLAPGSTVTVTVTDATGIDPPRTATARVTRETVDPGEFQPPKFVFETALNLSGVEPGTEIGLHVRPERASADSDYERSEYRAPVDSPAAAVDLATDPFADGVVRVANATLPAGGFVAVERVDGGTVVGSSDYFDPGTHEGVQVNVSDAAAAGDADLRVYLAHDSDGDGSYFRSVDRPYADSMRAVAATVPRTSPTTDSPPTGTATATPTPFQPSVTTESPTATPSDPSTVPPSSTATVHVDTGVTPTPPSTTDTSGTDGRTGVTAEDGSGFGSVAALAATMLVALLGIARARRRGR